MAIRQVGMTDLAAAESHLLSCMVLIPTVPSFLQLLRMQYINKYMHVLSILSKALWVCWSWSD